MLLTVMKAHIDVLSTSFWLLRRSTGLDSAHGITGSSIITLSFYPAKKQMEIRHHRIMEIPVRDPPRGDQQLS